MPSRPIRPIAAPLVWVLSGGGPQARELTLMTWNLGWHMGGALFQQWQAARSVSFALDSRAGFWKPTPAGATTGWWLKWGRAGPV